MNDDVTDTGSTSVESSTGVDVSSAGNSMATVETEEISGFCSAGDVVSASPLRSDDVMGADVDWLVVASSTVVVMTTDATDDVIGLLFICDVSGPVVET